MTDCAICLALLDHSLVALTCGHVFHANCITNWFNGRARTCPHCKQQSQQQPTKLLYEPQKLIDQHVNYCETQQQQKEEQDLTSDDFFLSQPPLLTIDSPFLLKLKLTRFSEAQSDRELLVNSHLQEIKQLQVQCEEVKKRILKLVSDKEKLKSDNESTFLKLKPLQSTLKEKQSSLSVVQSQSLACSTHLFALQCLKSYQRLLQIHLHSNRPEPDIYDHVTALPSQHNSTTPLTADQKLNQRRFAVRLCNKWLQLRNRRMIQRQTSAEEKSKQKLLTQFQDEIQLLKDKVTARKVKLNDKQQRVEQKRKRLEEFKKRDVLRILQQIQQRTK